MKILNVVSFKNLFLSTGNTGYKIAALDIGSKYIGVALADETKISVTPLGDIKRSTDRMSTEALQKLSLQLQKIINDKNVGGFVVGFPLLENGAITPLCEEIVIMMTALECKQNQSIHGPTQEIVCTFWDERNSSVGARRMAKNISGKLSVKMKFKDSFAACLILKGFINLSG